MKKALRLSLDTEFIGRCFIYLDSASSTNDIAKRSLQRLLSDGAIVITNNQTFGRGIGRRRWVSTSKDLTCTLILRDRTAAMGNVIQNKFHLETMVGTAILKAINALTGLAVYVNKNDIYFDNCKLGAIFIERFHRNKRFWYALGLGINCNSRLDDFPSYLQPKMTTIKECTDKSVEIDKLFNLVIKYFENIYLNYLKSMFLVNDCKNKNLTLTS